jgi:hypothetical protein
LVFYRLSVVTCATLARSTGFLPERSPHSTIAEWFVCQDLPTTSSLNSASERCSDTVLAEPSLSFAAFFPDLREDRVRRTLAKPAMTCVMRWIATLAAVNDRTLSQSARPAHPFGLLAAYSITGTLDSLQSLFPARLQLAAGLRRQLRQPGCDSKLPVCAYAQPRRFRPQC